MIELRPYQLDGVEKIRAAYRSGKRAPLYVAPTGSGKTVLFAYITKGAQTLGKKVLLLAHRVELIDQISAALTDQGVRHGIIAADYDYRRGHSIYVASVFTLVKRLDWFTPDLVIVDEAHHCAGTTTWARILQAYPKAHRLGVTATPVRKSGEGLSDCFDSLVLGPSTQYLIEIGALSPLRAFAPPMINAEKLHTRMGEFIQGELVDLVDRPSITGKAVEHYRKICDGKQTAVFCVSVAHAQNVAAEFRREGYASESVDGKIDSNIRRGIIGNFARGQIKVLTSCDLISEGFDCPRIEVGISLRPTQSLGLWRQQCGRILRPFAGKDCAYLLDAAGNTLRHGLPTDDVTWTLDGASVALERSKLSVRICPACFSAQSSRRSVCANCKTAFPIEARTVAQKKGDLEEMTPEQIAARRRDIQTGMTKDLAALIQLGKLRGYSNPEGWAKHVYESREIKRKRA